LELGRSITDFHLISSNTVSASSKEEGASELATVIHYYLTHPARFTFPNATSNSTQQHYLWTLIITHLLPRQKKS